MSVRAPKNVVVAGMPRSGTSLTMGILARHGYYVGPIERTRYREGDEHNPFGYFEADALVERNTILLERAGFPFHNTWLFDPISRATEERIRGLSPAAEDVALVATYEKRRRWAWKDPRLSYTLGYWWPLLDPKRTVVILTKRRAEDVTESFRRMGWPIQSDLTERIQDHFDAARRAITDFAIPHTVVEYEAYLERPEEMAQAIGGLTGLDVSVDDLNVRKELDHSQGPRGFRARVHRTALRLPTPIKRMIRRVTPRWALEVVLPEWRHVARTPEQRATQGTPEPRR